MASRLLVNDAPISVPIQALTPEGFRTWAASDEIPEGVRLSCGAQKVVIHPGTAGGEPVRIPASAATLDGFRAWATSDDFPQRGRISFFEQEILVDMSPEEMETHSKVKLEITTVLYRLIQKLKIGDFHIDRTLVTNRAAELSTEPDGAISLWASRKSGKVRRVATKDHPAEYVELQGTPDWVLEVVSRSSVRKDTQKLRRSYFRAGIPEYWLVNALGETIDFQILVRNSTAYAQAPRKGGWVLSPLFDRWFRLERRQNDMDDWDYRLRMKPHKQPEQV